MDVRDDLVGPHDLALVGRRDHHREHVVVEVGPLPLDDPSQVPGEAGRGLDVDGEVLGRQERIDELEALPRPLPQLVDVADGRDAEDVAGEVVRQREADLLDDRQLVPRRLPRQRPEVDDLLGPLAEPLDGPVAERRLNYLTCRGWAWSGPSAANGFPGKCSCDALPFAIVGAPW